ncbi:Triacylglycerol lipase 1 [Linum perenne]
MKNLILLFSSILLQFLVAAGDESTTVRLRTPKGNLCGQVIGRAGYPCTEHTIETTDGYLLALQRVSSRNGNISSNRGPPVLLQHGLFMEFWDWSWQELAMYDLAEMIHHIYSATSSKVFLVGHSQGTIMSLAALSQPKIVEMVEAAALLCPISYLDHVTAPLVHKMVTMHVDQMITAMGIHQLNFRSEFLINLLDSLCEELLHCDDLLSSITGDNCCFNSSRIDFYLDYEPHPSSSKNLRHLFQMIRKGTFAQYDYGKLKNLKQYGQASPPVFDLSLIPDSLPLWMGYGGLDGLADIDDMQHTLKELLCKTELLYLENYGHIDFLLSVKAKEDVYDHILAFFGSIRGSRSSA